MSQRRQTAERVREWRDPGLEQSPTRDVQTMSKAEQARTPGTASEWRQRKLARRLRDENPRRNRTLKAATAFEDERATGARRAECGIEHQVDELGRNSRTVARRIASSCAGWRHGPSAAEFCDAVRAEGPTRQQRSLIAMRVRGASDEELLLAWADEVYSDRMLVAAIHPAGAADANPQRNAALNRWARGR